MKILVSGASGLTGRALVPFLESKGNIVNKLVRTREKAGVYWNYETGEIDMDSLEGHDAVVHLAGETIVGRWTQDKKDRIRDSRVLGSKLISDSLAGLTKKPKTIIAASAIGYYGSRGDTVLTEDISRGMGFMADVCVDWEDAYEASEADEQIRVVYMRTGIVLSAMGGVFEKMLPPFKMGVGGRIGGGKQYWSWIAMEDFLGALYHCLTNESVRGPVNFVAPEPVTNSEFTHTLGMVLSRPTVIPLPAFVARGLFGEMADEAMLASARVHPSKLLDTGYKFRYPHLKDALLHLL